MNTVYDSIAAITGDVVALGNSTILDCIQYTIGTWFYLQKIYRNAYGTAEKRNRPAAQQSDKVADRQMEIFNMCYLNLKEN